jgi:hypothetical protein
MHRPANDDARRASHAGTAATIPPGRVRRARRADGVGALIGEEVRTVKSTSRLIPPIVGNGHGDRPRDALLVERPEVLEGAAAAREDQHVALGAPRSELQCADDGPGRTVSLHGHGVDQHRDRRKTPAEHVQDVAYGGAGRRGDHADPMRQTRQAALAIGIEQTFGGQAPLEFLEAPAQQAFAGLLEMIDHELELAARLVQAHACPRQYLRPVAHGEADQHVRMRNMAQRTCRPVLERQVPVA